jgi:hypothetical protein
LVGAKALTLQVRATSGTEHMMLEIGGVNRATPLTLDRPYRDNLHNTLRYPPVRTEWQPLKITINPGVLLDSVIGGFSIFFDKSRNPSGCTVYLDEIRYDNAEPNMRRFVGSYIPTAKNEDDVFRNACYLYDNVLTVMNFLAAGGEDNRHRAKLLADSLVWAQNSDRALNFRDGRWRNAYACGPLEDPETKTARLPGWFDTTEKRWLEDAYAVGSDAGNMAWAIISLLSAQQILAPTHNTYLDAAVWAGNWIEKHCKAGGPIAGYSGGYEGWEKTPTKPSAMKKMEWRSTEHNIDLYVAFLRLAALTSDDNWRKRAEYAKRFVLTMWNKEGKFFWTGTQPANDKINDEAVALDVQAWSILAMGHDPDVRRIMGWNGPPAIPDCIKWVEENCREQHSGDCTASGYKFSNNGSGVWFEGTAQMAAVYNYLGDSKKADEIVNAVLRANSLQSSASGSVRGIYAACPDPAFTGFIKEFVPGIKPWNYPRRLHIGATAWLGIAMAGLNPYWLGYP